jgi:uncharacterized protein (DUF952 family)
MANKILSVNTLSERKDVKKSLQAIMQFGYRVALAMGRVILHITKREQWEQAKVLGVYRGDTLDSQGFIHCSTPQQIVRVANALFHGQKGLALLCIDSDKVKAEIRYEGAEGKEQYPHIWLLEC